MDFLAGLGELLTPAGHDCNGLSHSDPAYSMQGQFYAGLQVAVSTLLTWVSCTQVAVGRQQVAVRPRLALLPGWQALCTALAGWLGLTDGPHLQAHRHRHNSGSVRIT